MVLVGIVEMAIPEVVNRFKIQVFQQYISTKKLVICFLGDFYNFRGPHSTEGQYGPHGDRRDGHPRGGQQV